MKQIRELLSENNFDPAQEMIDLAKGLKDDEQEYKEKIKEYADLPEIQVQMLVNSNRNYKTRLDVLKALTDAKQKEDDQRLKLEELELKKRDDERKQRVIDGTDKPTTTTFFIPAMRKEVVDGKIKLINLSDG